MKNFKNWLSEITMGAGGVFEDPKKTLQNVDDASDDVLDNPQNLDTMNLIPGQGDTQARDSINKLAQSYDNKGDSQTADVDPLQISQDLARKFNRPEIFPHMPKNPLQAVQMMKKKMKKGMRKK